MPSGQGLREWTVDLDCEITPELLARGDELARWRWGSSARIVSSDPVARTFTFLGPEVPGMPDSFARALAAGEGAPKHLGRARRKR